MKRQLLGGQSSAGLRAETGDAGAGMLMPRAVQAHAWYVAVEHAA